MIDFNFQSMRYLSGEGLLRGRPSWGWKYAGKDKPWGEESREMAVVQRILGVMRRSRRLNWLLRVTTKYSDTEVLELNRKIEELKLENADLKTQCAQLPGYQSREPREFFGDQGPSWVGLILKELETLRPQIRNLESARRVERIPRDEPQANLEVESPSQSIGAPFETEVSPLAHRYEISPSEGYGPFVAERRLIFEPENTPMTSQPRVQTAEQKPELRSTPRKPPSITFRSPAPKINLGH